MQDAGVVMAERETTIAQVVRDMIQEPLRSAPLSPHATPSDPALSRLVMALMRAWTFPGASIVDLSCEPGDFARAVNPALYRIVAQPTAGSKTVVAAALFDDWHAHAAGADAHLAALEAAARTAWPWLGANGVLVATCGVDREGARTLQQVQGLLGWGYELRDAVTHWHDGPLMERCWILLLTRR
ncbi:MAG: hypothetical protein ACYDBQ_10700 [Thermoplasmatota archaeon]